jgi:hypothetical protein
MNPATPQDLHVIAGLLVAVLAVLMVVAKVGGKFLDDWWEKTRKTGPQVVGNGNGNGDTKRVCFMGQGGSERITEHIDDKHDQLRDMIHQNHAAVITILDRLARTLEESKETTRGIETSIEILREILRTNRNA